MDSEYHHDLELIKESFRGTSETPLLADLILASTATIKPSILDVGIGSGTQMSKIGISLLESGVNARITGVDLFLPISVSNDPRFPIDYISCDFMSLDLSTKFDVVNATQSLYYFDDPQATLGKMLDSVIPGGNMFVTTWTSQCILYRIYQEFFGIPEKFIVTDEYTIAILKNIGKSGLVKRYLFDGEIDLELILRSDSNLKAFLHILSRKCGPGADCGIETLSRVRDYLRNMPRVVQRQNAIVSIQKSCR